MKKAFKFIIPAASACLLALALWLGWTWYDTHTDRSGWLNRDGATLYADFHGDPVTGWQTIGGNRYYFDEDFTLHTGWLTTASGTFYFAPDGKLQTLWADTGRGRCYFGTDGLLRTGWQTVNDRRCYFDRRGVLQTGWQTIEETRHYFLPDGTLATGWQETGEGRCFLNEDGSPTAGWLTWEDARYYLDEQGIPQTGWQTIGDSRYYFGETGALATGWQTLDESRFYFNNDGVLQTGWLEQGEYRYYFLPDGAMATGRQEIGGKNYYFTPAGIEVLLVNPKNPLTGDNEPTLAETEDGFRVDVRCLHALETMMAAMRAEGLLPMLSSAYRSKGDQAYIWQSYVNRFLASGYSESGANAMTAAYVAVPGTSEHHTGLAVDIVGRDYFYGTPRGATTAVQDWLAEHCWEHGFILRYTEEKRAITGFAPESWHFRYVGREVSMAMKDTGLCLEEYLAAVS